MQPPVRQTVLAAVLGCVVAGGFGCQDFRSFWSKRSLEGDIAAMEDDVFPDERRGGIAALQRRDEGKQEPYTGKFRAIATADPHPAVRAQAVRALNQARDEQAPPVFLAALSDPEAKVRLEAVKALRHAPDERTLPRLRELAGSLEQERDVRIWAIAALACYPRLDVARTLVPLLDGRDFGVAHEARQSLRKLTGKDFHYDGGLWLRLSRSSGPMVKV